MLTNSNIPLSTPQLSSFLQEIEQLSRVEFAKKNGNKTKWEVSLSLIKSTTKVDLTTKDDYLFVKQIVDKKAIADLRPWRKGPFAFENFNLDSEWNGNLKWQRLEKHLDFANKIILDVGCGNGYFALKMALKQAKLVLGLEPFMLFNYQFKAIQSLIKNTQNTILAPLKLEQINPQSSFDIVLSMGVLYHHKSPIEHILQLKKMLKSDGNLLLETLIVDGEDGYSLIPKSRYAKMRNVWFIPSKKTLISWLKKCGFSKITTIDKNITSFREQQKTYWIGDENQSLEDFIDKNDPNKTIEGYPRPQRIMLLCSI